MMRRLPTTPVRLSLGTFLTALAASSPAWAGNSPDRHQVQLRPEASTMIIELNGTDQDIGVQFFFDAEAWTSFNIFDPLGKLIYSTQTGGRLMRLGGGSEFSVESNEPALADMSFDEFFRRFPEGTYHYVGENADGQKNDDDGNVREAGEDEREPAALDVLGREHALHHVLIGAVRGHRGEGRSQKRGINGVLRFQDGLGVLPKRLALLGSAVDDLQVVRPAELRERRRERKSPRF